MSEYARLVGQLAQLTARVQARRAEADAWHDQQCAAANRAVARAEEAVRQAEEAVREAGRQVEAVDAAAGQLWQELTGRLGAHRVGDPPVPSAGAAVAPAALLDGVRVLLDRARRPRALPSSAYPLLAGFGLLGAGAAAALALAARAGGARYGGDLALGMPVLALVVTLFGPVVGLAPAKALAERRHAVLDSRAVMVVLVAGLASTAALVTILR